MPVGSGWEVHRGRGSVVGDIRGYTVQVSDDGETWREVQRGELASTWNPQQVKFAQSVTARQLKFTALSGFGPDTTVALAELAVIYAGPKLTGAGAGSVDDQRVRSTTPEVDEGPGANARTTNSPPRRGR